VDPRLRPSPAVHRPVLRIVSDDFPVFRRQRSLLIVQNRFRGGFARFKLGAHLLDLRRLFSELRRELCDRGLEILF